MHESRSSALSALAYRVDHATASVGKLKKKTLGRLDNLSSAECFFVWALAPLKINDHVTVTMIRFCTRIKSLHIWGIFSSRV